MKWRAFARSGIIPPPRTLQEAAMPPPLQQIGLDVLSLADRLSRLSSVINFAQCAKSLH